MGIEERPLHSPEPMRADFIHAEDAALLVVVDLGTYSTTALQKVAHTFTDCCFVHLQSRSPTQIEVRFRAKKIGDGLDRIAGEFTNALLDQSLREHLARETQAVRDLILAHALSRVPVISPELETVDPVADPLGIALPDAKKISNG